MSQRFSLIIGLLIIVIASAFFWWRSQSEKQINRQVDLFIESIEYRKLSLDSKEDRHVSYRELFAPVVEVSTPAPGPTGKFSLIELIEQIDQLQSFISYLEISEESRRIILDGDSAQVHITGNFAAASGPNARFDLNGTMFIILVRDDDWRIEAITLEEG